MPPRDPVLENIMAGKTSIGTQVDDPGAAKLMANVGFDYARMDMMHSPHDWGKVHNLVTECHAADITPIVRVESNPWIGYDHRVAVCVTRAQGVGFKFVVASVSGLKEAEECVSVAKDWHRESSRLHPFKSFEEWKPKIKKMSEETYVQPSVESKGGIEQVEQILEIPGLKAFHIAMTDSSKMILDSDTPDWNHPKLWEFLGKVQRICKKKDIVVGAGTSYAYTMHEMGDRIKKLHDAGVNMILVQSDSFLFQTAIANWLGSVKKDMK